ncbi:MAG: hypothetical protein KGH76_07035, partial [Thaumarchaeota archaeon]|nr:hypothetical protein [Nitrososphaerota archaeon]
VDLSLDCTPTSILTTKDSYYRGDFILIFGKTDPNCLMQVVLTDPNDKQAKFQQAMSDKQGIFSVFDFKIPIDGPTGTWSLETRSESHHLSTKFAVLSPISSPLKQSKSGVAAQDVKCNDSLQLVIKAEDGSPACVKPDTAQKLVERGWAKEIMTNSSLITNHGPPMKPF